jgi:hypothetical protein
MWRRLPARRGLLFLAAAVLSAVISDWVIETGANLGVYGPTFAGADHRSVLATATAGIVLAVAALAVTLLERWRVLRGDACGDWLVDAARDISAHWSWRAFPSTLAVALAVRYTMESAELVRTTGHVAVGLGWLGGPVLIALVLHAAFCVLTVLVLIAVMQAVVGAFDVVVVAVATLLAFALSAISPSGVFARRDHVRRAMRSGSCLGRRLGERAPPLATSA